MEKYLVDVPVAITIWCRTECQKLQLEVLKKAKPSIIFLISDGGRNSKEWEAINENRKLMDNGIDWECKVYRLYESENKGMYAISKKMHTLIWEKVESCIFLEDDVLPSVSFFQYCSELLEKYKDDKRINVICGMNHLGVSEDVNTDYFFSRQGSIWGFAMWRRTYEQYCDFSYGKDPYIMKLLKNQTRHNQIFWKRIKAYTKQEIYEGHTAWSEYFLEFSMYGQNQLQIIPKRNMISNIGCTKDSAHANELKLLPRGLRKIFQMETYEVKFPLKHAQYVIPDNAYEKKRNKILAYNYPIKAKWYSLEMLLLKFRYGNWQEAVKVIKNKIRRKVVIEK